MAAGVDHAPRWGEIVTTETSGTNKTTKRGLSRRSVVVGTAWAVPAIVVAGPAPHAAATPLPPLVFTGLGCKDPGNSQPPLLKSYVFQLSASNPFNTPLTITLIQFTINGINSPITSPASSTVVIPANQPATLVNVQGGTLSNSANGIARLTYSYVDPTTGLTVTETISTAFNSLPPVQGNQCPIL